MPIKQVQSSSTMLLYKAYITEKDIPECLFISVKVQKPVPLSFCSFSKTAGFTGLRLAYTVILKELKCGDVQLHALWARRHGTKIQRCTYIIQRAGEAVYSEAGKAQYRRTDRILSQECTYIFNGLKEAGYTVAGGVTPCMAEDAGQMNSWEFFDYLLKSKRGRNTGFRIRTKRRRLFPSDCIRYFTGIL